MLHGRRIKAFTLIEVILAMMVMSSGLFILTNAWAGTYTRLQKTQVQVQLAALLERKVTEIEREFKGKSLDTIPQEKEDDFGSDIADYSWKMKSRKLEFPDLTSVLTSKTGGANEIALQVMKLFTEYISKAVREIKITVIYKSKKKPVSADVTIYMIDYDRPIQVPGMGAAGAGG